MTYVHFCGIPILFSDTGSLHGKGGMNRTEAHIRKITDFCNIADLSCQFLLQEETIWSFYTAQSVILVML